MIRVQFRDESRANLLLSTFEPYSLDCVQDRRWKKRDGASHVVLLNLDDESDFERFVSACRSHADVIDVRTISNQEFWQSWDAPSNNPL
jgi:hypothetical protein